MRTSEHIPAGGIAFDGGNRLVKKLLEWLGLRKPADPVMRKAHRKRRWYIGKKIIFNGTERTITDYNPETRVATVKDAWRNPPELGGERCS